MERNKWQVHRAGVLNFWYYDEEEFHFAKGKLLLRGSNGSGKSVTMQSLIPVLLDGKKSPDRLDPFGSKARRMEDYLLGEKGVVERDERTGYIFLEYKREGTNQYLTTGIGLRAKRHSSLDFWGFVIHDNRRVGRDFQLYKTDYNIEGKEEKIPLSRRELENRLELGGKVVQSQGDYMKLVNKYLFGFESIEAYEELIKLLIQLRSPKLSKDFKPTVIYEILNEALPAIGDEELRPLSDTIENMDQIKQQLEQLKREQQSLARLCKQYDLYNQIVLTEKADGLLQSFKRKEKISKKTEELKLLLEENKEEVLRLAEELTALSREQEVLKDEEKQLKSHDAFRAEQDKLQMEEKNRITTAKKDQKQGNLQQKKKTELNLRKKIAFEEEIRLTAEKQLKKALDEMEEAAQEAEFNNHALAAHEFLKTLENGYVFDLWRKEADDYKQKLGSVLKVLREFSKTKERYQEVDRELGEACKELELKRNEERKWEDLFEEEKSKYLEVFHLWRKGNTELALTDEEIQLTVQKLMQIYEPYRFDQLREISMEARHRKAKAIETQVIKVETEIKAKKQEMKEKSFELEGWKAKEDPEPKRHKDTLEARKKLVQAGVPNIPFFAGVEFFADVASEERERIESAITQMGLLDALIVPEQYLTKEFTSDRIIKPNPQLLAHTLADFLYPTPMDGIKVTGEDIDKVLRSILVGKTEETTASLTEDGCYQIGLLGGHAPKETQSIYIGKESRQQYRKQEIIRIEGEIEILQAELATREDELRSLNLQNKRLEEEYQTFPNDDDMHEAFQTRRQLQKERESAEKVVEGKNLKLNEILAKLEKIRNQLRVLTEGLTIDVKEEAFQEAVENMEQYIGQLQELQLTYKDFANSLERLKQYQESLEEVCFDVDELNGEINLLEGELVTLSLTLTKIKERLQELGAEEISQRIEQVVKRLEEVPKEIIELTKKLEEIKHSCRDKEKEIINIQQELKLVDQLFLVWQQVFVEDDKLQLVEQVEPSAWASQPEIIKRAKSVGQRYGHVAQAQPNLDREKASQRLNESFFREQGILVEYRLTQENILEQTGLPDLSDLPEDSYYDNYQIQLQQVRQKARRIQLILEYNGKRVSPYFIQAEMEKDLELQQNLLNTKDQELYEEIIMNNVGRIIRGRINRAEKWVGKINSLMEERDTSSGLTFSLSWKPKTAEHEEEMDTKELVDLLRSDARLLKEEDMAKVTLHFRSKITRAKEMIAEKGYGETLHQVIKEMLDYRKWFSFILYYRREGEQRKELTNNVFFTFSGGEKAMAMYIPLFSAAYSRYMEARADAPFIISLDEAFAGVDENNIRDMFDLMEKLGFNYIINSQAIWGDYDTVSSLAICELIRPKNAPFVTVVRYHWDGKIRHLLTQKEKDERYYEEESA